MVDSNFLSQEEIDALLGNNVAFSGEDQLSKSLQADPDGEQAVNLDLIMDFPLQLSVRLGEVKKNFRELLQISPGTVIEMDRLVNEHVDIFVNNKLIARGEVIVVGETFGVKIAYIIDPLERIARLA
jgi:flagellar motor switch protein FliN/FliY